MRLLRAFGWVAASIAALCVLIVGAVYVAHSASASPGGINVPGQGTGTAIDPAYFSPGACVAFGPTAGNRI
jgi:hypothetical protein